MIPSSIVEAYLVVPSLRVEDEFSDFFGETSIETEGTAICSRRIHGYRLYCAHDKTAPLMLSSDLSGVR